MKLSVLHFILSISLSAVCFADNAEFPPLENQPVVTGQADPYFSKSWQLESIRAPEAWRVSMGKRSTVVAVIDSGVNYNHPELNANIYRKSSEYFADGYDSDGNGYIDDSFGWNFFDGNLFPIDHTGHGTFMSYLIAGRYGNGKGGAGVCPYCTILPLAFIGPQGGGDTSDAISAIYYAAKAGARVINLSFSSEGYHEGLALALEEAGRKDIVVVVAASNDGFDLDYEEIYPAKYGYSFQLTVAASSPDGSLHYGSNWGVETVDVAAPGEDLWGPGNTGWHYGSGTSQATAVASGAVALVRSVAPELTARQVTKLIRNTSHQTSGLQGTSKTGGVIDVAKAVECARHKLHPCLVN